MKHEEVAKLLEKFMSGLTSLEEEQRLAQFFNEGDVPSKWLDYKYLFAEIEALDEHADDAKPTVPATDEAKIHVGKSLPLFMRKPFVAIAVAAAVAAFFVVTLFNGGDETGGSAKTLAATAPADTTTTAVPDTAATLIRPDSNAVRLKRTRKRPSFRRQHYVDDPRPLYAGVAKAVQSDSSLAADTTDFLLAIRQLEIEMDTTRMRLIQQQCEMEAYGKYLSNVVYANEGLEPVSEEEYGEGEENIATY